MAVAKMKLVNIVGRLRDFDTVVRSCCMKGNFHPEQSTLALDNVEEFIPIEEMNPYVRPLQKMVDIGVHSGINLRYSSFKRLDLTEKDLNAYAEKVQNEVDALNSKVRELSLTVARLEQGIAHLSHIKNFVISLDDLFSSKFVSFRFGRLPKDSYQKLDVYDESDFIFFFPLEEDNSYFWGFYVAPKKMAEKADEVFTSLYFERIQILEEAKGTPSEAIEKITAELGQKSKELYQAKQDVSDYIAGERDVFLRAYSKIRYLHDSFELRKYASKCNDNFYIFGWVPETEIHKFSKQFDSLPDVDCVVESTEEAENIDPPTSLVNSKALKPFEMFVGMYGLPSYNEIDPTPFMAFTYTLFFGIMFGDLGQGAVIFLLGMILWRLQKSDFSGILARIGVSSMIFGTLYNSVFGFEHALPFTILPVHENANVSLVLFSTVGIGILTILVCMIINLINAIRQKDYEKLLFSQNGFSGIVFYASVILSFVFLLLFKKNIISPVFVICLIVLPLILMFLKEPLSKIIERKKDWKPNNVPEFLLQSFFELFEIILSFMTNTISFIRIGAYVLSHAGMMTAVFALSGMVGEAHIANAGNLIGVILGNAFVLLLEGLIVGIQGIRLQFYEMFSRFYDGGGKPYNPARINY